MPGRGSAFCGPADLCNRSSRQAGFGPGQFALFEGCRAVLKGDPPRPSGSLERPASSPLLRRTERRTEAFSASETLDTTML